MQPLIMRIVWLGVGAGVLGAILLAAPAWVRIGLQRYANPLGEVEWPRSVEIVPLTGDLKAAIGDSVTVRMKVARGEQDALRGVVRLRDGDGEPTALAMRRDADGTYQATIDAVTGDLHYWFEAGDDTTEPRPFVVRVVARPEVIEATATIEPPAYAPSHPLSQQDLNDGPVSATIGGHVRVVLLVSKPIESDEEGVEIGLRTSNNNLIPLSASADNPLELSVRFEVREDVEFRPELRDRDGFENRGANTYVIRVVPDQPPTVYVLEPQAVTEATPAATIRLIARVGDDFGLKDVSLRIERGTGDEIGTNSLTDRLRVTQTQTGAEGTVDYPWDLAPLNLTPGDSLVGTLSATDNFESETSTGQVGQSAPIRVKIISAAELEARLRSEMAILETRIRQATLDQADVLDQTRLIADSAAEDGSLSDSERADASNAAAEQARLIRPLRDIAQRVSQWRERLRQNALGEGEAGQRLTALEQALLTTADGSMSRSVLALNQAAEPPPARGGAESATRAAQAQEQALTELQSLIRSLAQWGSFQGLITRSQDLLERQERLRSQTGELGRTMLGKSVDSLSPDEVAELKRTRREQEQLADDVEQLLQRMARTRTESGGKDASADEAIDAALRAARAGDLTKRLESAGEAIEDNRTAAATIEQKAAANGIRRMIAALREREDRELDQLRKRLGAAEEQLTRLIDEQSDLQRATQEAAAMAIDRAAEESLADEQRRLRNNTLALAQELSDVERTATVGQTVGEAAPPMEEAEDRIVDQQITDAVAPQGEALSALRRALEELQQLAQEAADRALRRSLAQIREDLEDAREAQWAVNVGIAGLKEDVQRLERMGRSQTREATRLATEQSSVRAIIDEMLPELEKVIVYRWALERVAGWMDQSKSALDARKVDSELVAATDRIVRELDKLIGAITETEALPFITEFAESDSGDGAGQTATPDAIPTVAELLVLKKLQTDINERTRESAGTLVADEPTEEQLRQLKEVGDDQTEVRRLTDLVVNRARQP